MRRREDHVWALVQQQHGLANSAEARRTIESSIKEGMRPEAIPRNAVPRPALHDLRDRTPSAIFNLLLQPTHHVAAWLLNQVYLAFPNPDENWAGDCQTENFHARVWESLLLACFREQGMLVTQPYRSPDFHIENRRGEEAWIEAVTANPPVRYNHFNAEPQVLPRTLGNTSSVPPQYGLPKRWEANFSGAMIACLMSAERLSLSPWLISTRLVLWCGAEKL
jgi:hypothetical protein